MKKIFIAAVYTIVCTAAAHAQIAKGTVLLGTTVGSTSYSSASDNLDYTSGTNINKSTDTKTYGFNIGPQVGVFLTNHFVLGGTLTYNITSRKTDATTTSTVNTPVTAHTNATNYTLNIGPFIRYYFYNTLSNNLLYVQANTTVGTGNGASSGYGENMNSTYTSDGKVSNIFNWNAGASIGLAHFFGPSVALDVALGYAYTSSKNGTANTTVNTNKNTSNVTVTNNNYDEKTATNGISLGAGFHWYLNRHHKA